MNRHFILTHGRSGSNFLANCLNKHQSLVNYGEVLGEWTQPYRLFKLYKKAGKGWPEYLDALYTSSTLFYAAQSVSALKHLKTGRKINFKRKSAIKSLGVKDFVFLANKPGALQPQTTTTAYAPDICKRTTSLLNPIQYLTLGAETPVFE